MKIKTNVLKYKDPDTGTYAPIPIVVSGDNEEIMKEITELNEKLVQETSKLSKEIEDLDEKKVSCVDGFFPDANGAVTLKYEATSERTYRHEELTAHPHAVTVFADERYTNNPFIFLGKNYWPAAVYTDLGFNKFGLTYKTDGHNISVNGTATTGSSFSLLNDASSYKWKLPADIAAGDGLKLHLFGEVSEKNSPFCKVELYNESGSRIDYTQTRLSAGKTYAASGVLTIPEGVSYVMFKFSFNTGDAFENNFFPVLVKSNTLIINDVQFTDGYTEVNIDAEVFDVCTAPYTSVVKYMLDTQKYIDTKISEVDFDVSMIDNRISFVSPEMFGAYGDYQHDDTVAIQSCIDYAIANKIKMIGGKRYRTSSPLVIAGDSVDINILQINYSGVDCAVIVNGSYNNISIGAIYAEGGAGFRLNSDINSSFGQYYVGRVFSKENCVEYIVTQSDIVGNRLTFSDLYSTGANCIYQSPQSTIATGGKWNGNNNFIGGRLAKGEWGVYNAHGEDSYITCQFEGVKNGIRMMGVGNCRIIAPRYTELIYEAFDRSVEGYPLIDGKGVFLKYVRPVSVWQDSDTKRTQIEIAPSGGYIFPVNIDLSDMPIENTYSDGRVYKINKDSTEVHTIYAHLVSRTGWDIANSFLIFGKHILVKYPTFRRTLRVYSNNTGYNKDYRESGLEEEFKIYSKFVINENGCDYRLPPSYDIIAFDKFEIEQPEGCYAVFRDWRGTVIFDGAKYGAGSYELQAYRRDNDDWDDYDNRNQMWVIRKIANSIVDTMPLEEATD